MSDGSYYGFAADLDAFARHVNLSVQMVRKKIAFDLFGKMIERSPVDTGRFRMSWAMADGAPAAVYGPEGGTGGDGAAADSAARANITARFQDPFSAIYITNPLPYAERLEFGYSQKAPAGMVRVSLAEIEIEIATAGKI